MPNLKFFRIIKTPSEKLLEILKANIIGTPSIGMLYQHLGVENKINKIENPFFVNLERNNNIVGTCCFCSRSTMNNATAIDGFYIRYFSFRDLYRRKNINKKLVSGNSLLREEIKSVLQGSGLEKSTTDKFYHYAYVDPRNIRSVLLCNEFGFEKIRTYTTVIFNRVFPKENTNIEELSPQEENCMKELLSDYYKSYTMFSFENLFRGRKYYVIKDSDRNIIAGVQASIDSWKIIDLPGLSGKIILNIFTYLPILKRLFNKKYNFLALDRIYCVPGKEKYLEELLEGLLFSYKLNNALVVVDVESKLYKTLRTLNLGLVDKLNKEVRGNVITRTFNFSEDEKKLFRTNPVYISGIDVS